MSASQEKSILDHPLMSKLLSPEAMNFAKTQYVLKTPRTAPFDYRFASTTDQSKYCFVAYNEYLISLKKFGPSHDLTKRQATISGTMCSTEQLKAFYEARRDDLWTGYQCPMQEYELEDGDVIVHREKKSHDAHH